jgi:hypothetical protein
MRLLKINQRLFSDVIIITVIITFMDRSWWLYYVLEVEISC